MPSVANLLELFVMRVHRPSQVGQMKITLDTKNHRQTKHFL
ncbi:hypothetical protein D019_2431 [Vibrio parahaemolyticus VP2007-095]|nr:hypothetical protein D019_2431 [Vibrio parahaemolyticus VP2007-095]